MPEKGGYLAESLDELMAGKLVGWSAGDLVGQLVAELVVGSVDRWAGAKAVHLAADSAEKLASWLVDWKAGMSGKMLGP